MNGKSTLYLPRLHSQIARQDSQQKGRQLTASSRGRYGIGHAEHCAHKRGYKVDFHCSQILGGFRPFLGKNLPRNNTRSALNTVVTNKKRTLKNEASQCITTITAGATHRSAAKQSLTSLCDAIIDLQTSGGYHDNGGSITVGISKLYTNRNSKDLPLPYRLPRNTLTLSKGRAPDTGRTYTREE